MYYEAISIGSLMSRSRYKLSISTAHTNILQNSLGDAYIHSEVLVSVGTKMEGGNLFSLTWFPPPATNTVNFATTNTQCNEI